MSNIEILKVTDSPIALANSAIGAVVNGDIDPIKAHISVCRMEQAIKAYKASAKVRDITLRELSKYANNRKAQQFGDCTLQEKEASVKYDYSGCGDSKLAAMYATAEALSADIKERERMLKNIPVSGMADPDTGELIYPPAKSSVTTIQTTFKK